MGNNLTRRVQEANQPAGATGAEVAERDVPLIDSIRDMEGQFKLAMPRGLEAAQLIRDAITCLRTTRNLARCDRASVLGGLMTCAQLGLRPGVLGHAWLLPFWDKNLPTVDERGRERKGGYRAQLVIGYQGYRELAQRSGQIDTLIGRVIYEHDTFDIDYGIADNLVHKPKLDGTRGEPVGYYTIVKYTTGGYAFWHMSKAEAEEHRDRFAMAKAKDGVIVGPWRDNFDEMAVKTTFLKLAKWMPKSTELASAIAADETVRVDLSPNPDALLHGQRPTSDVIDGEFVDDQPDSAAADEPAELQVLRSRLAQFGVTNDQDQDDAIRRLLKRPAGASILDVTPDEATRVTHSLDQLLKDANPSKALDAVLAALEHETNATKESTT